MAGEHNSAIQSNQRYKTILIQAEVVLNISLKKHLSITQKNI